MRYLLFFLFPLALLAQPGGVQQIRAGSGVTVSSPTGIVTISATGGTGNVTAAGTLAADAIMLGDGLKTSKTTTTGANVVTALGIAIGSLGGVQLNNGSGAGLTSVNAATLGGATFAAPGAIGGATPNTGAFTTISVTGQVTSTLATGTAPFVIASTTQVANLYAARAALADTVTTNANLTGPVTSTGNATAITDGSVVLADMADLAQDQFIVRTTASTGVPQTATVTAAARTVLDDATVGAMVDTLGGASSTGTGGLVRITSPALVTPILGVAAANSVNKVAITAPATSATLTVADGITLTATQTTNLNRQSSTGLPVEFSVACSDLTTTLTTGTTKAYFRAPYAFTVTEVRASVNTPQTSGSLLTVDINDGGTTILSTKLTIDNNENTSTTAATPPVISDTAIADDAIIAVDIDTVGTGAVTGLVVWVKGYR